MTNKLIPTHWRSSPRAEQRARELEDRARYGTRTASSLRREIAEELTIIGAGADVSTEGLTPGRARAQISELAGPLRWQVLAAQLSADGNTPELIAVTLEAEVERLAGELIAQNPVDWEYRPDEARRMAREYLMSPAG